MDAQVNVERCDLYRLYVTFCLWHFIIAHIVDAFLGKLFPNQMCHFVYCSSLLIKVDPALGAVALDLAGVVEVEDGRREEEGQHPRSDHQATSTAPRT